MGSHNTSNIFEFRRKIDDTVYRYHPCEPLHGQLAWKREDLDLWVTKVPGHGWACVNAGLEILAVPFTIAVDTQDFQPPVSITLDRRCAGICGSIEQKSQSVHQ